MPLLALILTLRKHPRQTQAQLARRLQVSQATVATDLQEIHVAVSKTLNERNQRVNAYELSLPPKKLKAIAARG